MFRLADVLFFHGRPILPDSPRPLNNAKTAGSVEGNRRAAALFNKPRRDNPYQPFCFDDFP
jgi:hypothetical protein